MEVSVIMRDIEEWYPMPLNMGPPLPKWLGITWPWYKEPSTDFFVSKLTIYPEEVYTDQVVTISCLVTNNGDEAGIYTVQLRGELEASKEVTLQPGESKEVSFEARPHVAKTYSFYLDGLHGSFTAIEAPPEEQPAADFYMPATMVVSVTDGQILDMYWNCSVSLTITNHGPVQGTQRVRFWDSVGNLDTTIPITLEPGQTYVFTHSQFVDFRRLPTYTVYAEGDWPQNNKSTGECRP
jgi:hypothetical protein